MERYTPSPKYSPPTEEFKDAFKPGIRPPTPAEAAKHRKDYPFVRAVRRTKVSLPPEFVQPQWWGQNQRNRGACASFGMLRSAMAARLLIVGDYFDASEEALYADYLQHIGEPCQDNGAWPGTLADRMVKIGVAHEQDMPYMSTNLCTGPDEDLRLKMAQERPVAYFVAGEDWEIKQAIYEGYRVAACFTLAQNFGTTWVNGTLMMPFPEGGVLGGHLMDYDGWNDTIETPWGRGGYWCFNQYGDDFGRFLVPYAVHNLPGWQQDGFGFWRDAAYVMKGWNGRLDPTPAPGPDPQPAPDTDFQRRFKEEVQRRSETHAERLDADWAGSRGHQKYKANLWRQGANARTQAILEEQ